MENVQDAVLAKIRQNPKFAELVRRRGRFAWTLAFVVLALFYGFVLLVAFNPGAVGVPLSAGSRVTFGMAAGMFIFMFSWLLTAYYVYRANGEFDALTREMINEAWQEAHP